MIRPLFIALAAMLLQACGTINYVPEEYVIAEGRIQKFDLRGNVVVENIQPDTTERIFYAGGAAADWKSNYNLVTEHLKEQLKSEIGKNGNHTGGAVTKTLQVKVENIQATMAFFHFVSTMDVMVQLGNAGPSPNTSAREAQATCGAY